MRARCEQEGEAAASLPAQSTKDLCKVQRQAPCAPSAHSVQGPDATPARRSGTRLPKAHIPHLQTPPDTLHARGHLLPPTRPHAHTPRARKESLVCAAARLAPKLPLPSGLPLARCAARPMLVPFALCLSCPLPASGSTPARAPPHPRFDFSACSLRPSHRAYAASTSIPCHTGGRNARRSKPASCLRANLLGHTLPEICARASPPPPLHGGASQPRSAVNNPKQVANRVAELGPTCTV